MTNRGLIQREMERLRSEMTKAQNALHDLDTVDTETIPTGTDAWSEADLLRNVREWAEAWGWLTYHPWSSIHSPEGFPDLVMVRGPTVLFVELKAHKGKLTEAQQAWATALQAAGQQWCLWRPSDFDTIMAVLR